MSLTTEQQSVITHLSNPTADRSLTLIDAIAGSGKTTLLVAISNTLSHSNGLYLAYNSSVAKEAARKFPSTTHCMTTHALAYRAVVKPNKLTIGTFTYKNILEAIPYGSKCALVDHIRAFCLSNHLSFASYASAEGVATKLIPLAVKYLDLMQSGKIECTHDFYLKFFHILLANGSLTYDPFDFIMLDEAGDLNEVTLAIFQLLPTPIRIAVGDKHQNIYQFNDTINCFSILEGQGTLFHLSQSFRVSDKIAPRIEQFCRSYLDPSFSFRGVPLVNTTISSAAFLTRTNASLIQRMVELNNQLIPYSLVRSPQEIFRHALMVCSFKYQGFITDPAYKYLQSDINDWYESEDIRVDHPTLFSYLIFLNDKDDQLIRAIRLVQRYGKNLIPSTYEDARKHTKTPNHLTLATAHSTKGLEFDEVTIADDLNESLDDIPPAVGQLSPKQLEAVNLYYVACTRAAKRLNNARHL